MNRSYLALTAATAMVLGCNPSGTCIHEGSSRDGDPATCTLSSNKKACGAAQPSTFFAEAPPAGLTRCKGMAFEGEPEDTPEKIIRDIKEKDSTYVLYAMGTCIEQAPASTQKQCIVHWSARLCDQTGHQFFRENPGEGIVRCKTAGFTITGSATDDIAKNGSAIFSRKK